MKFRMSLSISLVIKINNKVKKEDILNIVDIPIVINFMIRLKYEFMKMMHPITKLKYLFVYTYAKKQKLIPITKPIPIEFIFIDSKVLVMLLMAFNKSKTKN